MVKDFATDGVPLTALGLGCDARVDPFTGAASCDVTLPMVAGRAGMTPALALSWSLQGGPSPFGHGWALTGLPTVGVDVRRRGPAFDGTDTFVAGDDELVPLFEPGAARPWVADVGAYRVRYFRTRASGRQRRLEEWTHRASGRVHWRARDADDTVTVYGEADDDSSRVFDPIDPVRVFLWLADRVVDAHGSAIQYDYVAEDRRGASTTSACERSRLGRPQAQRYLKRVRYGNSRPLGVDTAAPAGNTWSFEVVFDYGDHSAVPAPAPNVPWPAREDAFSSWPGFEVRTYRRCQRVLWFHRLDDTAAPPALVRELRLTFDADAARSQLGALELVGHRAGGASRALPPLRFGYQAPQHERAFSAATVSAVTNAPAGLSGRTRLVDLQGDGLAGILTEGEHAWYYKANEGGGDFAPHTTVLERPASVEGAFSIGDFNRDGNTDLVNLSGPNAGYYTLDRASGRWSGFRALALPHVEALGDDAQWIDLNGDGRPDVIVSQPDHFVWFPSTDEGFGAPVHVPRPVDADGPPLLAERADLRFFFADLSGSRNLDLVRVGNGRIEYWPHLGSGRFGARVVMDGAPSFDDSESFDAARVRFVHLSGSGPVDLAYLGHDEVRLFRNAAGNQWLEAPSLRGTPTLDRSTSVRVVDFFGDGRQCLVASTPNPSAVALQLLALTPTTTPGALVSIDDGQGRRQVLSWSSSAAHYLKARRQGTPWRTSLPLHVPVVDELATFDDVAGAERSERFEYFDGFFDAGQRVIGFGRVEVTDATTPPGGEAFSPALSTRTWFHTGAPQWGTRLPGAWAQDAAAPDLAAHDFERPDLLAPGDFEDALSLLAGRLVRQERYSVTRDGERQPNPLDVLQRRHRLHRVQPRHGAALACWAVEVGDAFESTYEGATADPRVTHHCLVELDAFEQPAISVEVDYPRRGALDVAGQGQLRVVASVQRNASVETAVHRRIGVPVETVEFEVHGLALPASGWLSDAELNAPAVRAALQAPRPHHDLPAPGVLAARRLSWSRSYYWNDATTAALPLSQLGTHALLHHEEAACFTTAGVTATLGARATPALLQSLGYRLRDGHWWRLEATHHWTADFGLLQRQVRSDGAEVTYRHDARALRVDRVTDSVGVVEATFDYHHVQAQRVTDANGAVLEIRYDALGVAIAGSTSGTLATSAAIPQPWGGSLTAFQPVGNLPQALANPSAALQGASWVLAYDLDQARLGRPNQALRLTRERLFHDGFGGGAPNGPVDAAITYLDGFRRVLQGKQRVDAGPAITRDAAGNLVLDPQGAPALAPAAERWVATGFRLFDRRQLLGREHEPFFSPSADFEDDAALRTLGGSTLTAYDALGRVVGTTRLDGAWTRVEYLAWERREHDENDTVAQSTWRLPRETKPATDPERLALTQALPHADTPTSRYLAANGLEVGRLERASTPGEDRHLEQTIDASGAVTSLRGARGYTAFEYRFDMEGQPLSTRSADAGETLTLMDAWGRARHLWDPGGAHQERTYDASDRLTSVTVDGQRVEERAYGDALGAGPGENAHGRLVRVRDLAGELRIGPFDPTGAPLRTERRLLSDHRAAPDWALAPTLEATAYATEVRTDALGRVVQKRTADGVTRAIAFAPGGLMQSLTATTADGQLTEPIAQVRERDARGRAVAQRLGAVDLTSEFDRTTGLRRRSTALRPADGLRLLDLRYVHDPTGNVTRVDDLSQGPGWSQPLAGLTVPSAQDFTYDAHYRLKSATGRVHQALLPADERPSRSAQHVSLNNAMAVERYRRQYDYDRDNNLTQVSHVGATQRWNTTFWVDAASNRSTTSTATNPAARFDAAGRLTALDHLSALDWSHAGKLRRAVLVDRSASGEPDDAEYYAHGADGLRVRKVYERLTHGGVVELTEKLYLDDCELKRVRSSAGTTLERWTSHFLMGGERVAVLHQWSQDDTARETDDVSAKRLAYLLANQVGSALLALDGTGAVLSYEEYFPYGGTSFAAGASAREVRLREWRFSSKERDEATGLYDFGQRSYAPWLCRFLTPDPIGPEDSLNLYEFARSNPVTLRDRDGLQSTEVVGTVPIGLSEQAAVRAFNRSTGLRLGIQITRLEKVPLTGKDKGWDWRIPDDAIRPLNAELAEYARKDFKKAQQVVDALAAAGLEPSPANAPTGQSPPGGEPKGQAEEARAGKQDAGATKPEEDKKNGVGIDDGAPTKKNGDGGSANGTQDQGAGGGLAGGGKPEGDGGDAKTPAVPGSTGDVVDGKGLGAQGTGAGRGGELGTDATAQGRAEGGTAGGVDETGTSGTGRENTDGPEERSGTGAQSGGKSDLAPSDGRRPAPPGLQKNGDDVNGSVDGSPSGVRYGTGKLTSHGRKPATGDARPGTGGHGGSGGGTGKGSATALDQVARIAGYTQLEFDKAQDGASGGIPGGRGKWSSKVGQLLYIAVAIASVISLIGQIRNIMRVGLRRTLMMLVNKFRGLNLRFWTRGFWTNVRRFFVDGRPFRGRWCGPNNIPDAVSNQYWARFGPADGRSLHHWLFPQRWRWVPEWLRNAGLNLLELPHFFLEGYSLNSRMGGFPTMRPVYQAIEWGFRLLVPAAVAGAGYGGYQLGTELQAPPDPESPSPP